MNGFNLLSITLLSGGFAATITVLLYALKRNQTYELNRSKHIRVKRQLKKMLHSTTELDRD
ncbi:hypothetical protein [Synechococcus sp. UW140]|uniref:hypothetical protein n=1 Tax=Synechococcus sp. UW140 TaxID=368503 RepID=UPI000E0E3C08|nr:hypothetical protein [Synechococcus sp. UW140]